jgi:hypothetical protein
MGASGRGATRADFSFDALVTEAASLDALRQRFGRLNRMGAPGAAPATSLARERDLKEGQPDDPIYGGAIRACWALLNDKATAGEGEVKCIDLGFDALDLDTVRELLSNASRERLGAALFEPWTYSDERLSMR